MTEIIITALTVTAGGVVQGCTGFGLALVVVPPLLLFLPQTFVVPFLVLLGLTNTSILVYQCRKSLHIPIILPLITGAVMGVPIGTYFLTTFDGPLFKIGVGLFIVTVSGILMSGWTKPMRNQTAGLIPVGVVSGFLHGSITVSGPPIVLFLSNQGVAKDIFRGSLAAYFLLINIVTVISFSFAGVWRGETITRALIYSPLLIIGTLIGARLSHRIPEQSFRNTVLVFAITMGAVLTVTNLRDIL